MCSSMKCIQDMLFHVNHTAKLDPCSRGIGHAVHTTAHIECVLGAIKLHHGKFCNQVLGQTLEL